MKKKTLTLIATGMLCLMTACGNSDRANSRQGSTNVVDDAIQSQIAIENGKAIVDDNPNGEARTTEKQVVKQAPTEQTTEQQTTEQVATEQPASEAATTAAVDDTEELKGEPDPNVDIDLSVMGSNMIYATVYDMMAHPDNYVGKKIKIEGDYTSGYYEPTDKWYHYCFISDAAACCQQGLEFTWDDGSHELDEFPADGAKILVEGTFEIYKDFEDDEFTYCQLADASLSVVDSNGNQNTETAN